MTMLPVRRPMMLAGVLLGALTCATLAPTRAQDTGTKPEAKKDDTAYSWTYRYKKGETIKLRQHLEITGQPEGGTGIDVQVEGKLKSETKEVAENGDFTIVSMVESQHATYNGSDIPDDPANHVTVTQTFSKMGRIVEVKVDGPMNAERIAQMASMLAETPVPEKPVKIGDTWKTEINNRMVEGKKVTLTSTLVGTEKVAGTDTLKVKVEMAIPTAAAADEKTTIKVMGTYNVDPKMGRLLRTDYTADNLEIALLMGNLRVKMAFKNEVIVPGVNDKEEKETKEAKPEEKVGK